MIGAGLEGYRRGRFHVLFGLLFLTLVASPLLRAFGIENNVFEACVQYRSRE